ncbi:MAG: YraN family protein [Bellilinea sp.]|jgi:putative endonuclease
MPSKRQKFGAWGESIAAAFIKNRGYILLGRNVRTPYGEVDLVASLGDTIIFFEVKTRSNDEYGLPEEAVNQRKLEHLINAAQHYLEEERLSEHNWRIDVIAIRGIAGQVDPEIKWFENVSA